jgi:hypothetical protein
MQVGIWEERKVFGSRGQILKEEIAGRHAENNNRDAKPMSVKPTNVKLVMFLYVFICIHIYALHAVIVSLIHI